MTRWTAKQCAFPWSLLHFNHIWQRAFISVVVDYHKLLLLLLMLLARLQINGPIGSNLHHNLIAVARLSRVFLRSGDVSNDVLLFIVGGAGDSLVGNRGCVLEAVVLKQGVIVKDLSNHCPFLNVDSDAKECANCL